MAFLDSEGDGAWAARAGARRPSTTRSLCPAVFLATDLIEVLLLAVFVGRLFKLLETWRLVPTNLLWLTDTLGSAGEASCHCS